MLTPLALAGGGLIILGIKYIAEHRTGPLGWIARVLVSLGSLAVFGAVIAAIVAGAAVFALIAVVFAFMIPLALINSAAGIGRREVYPRRYY